MPRKSRSSPPSALALINGVYCQSCHSSSHPNQTFVPPTPASAQRSFPPLMWSRYTPLQCRISSASFAFNIADRPTAVGATNQLWIYRDISLQNYVNSTINLFGFLWVSARAAEQLLERRSGRFSKLPPQHMRAPNSCRHQQSTDRLM